MKLYKIPLLASLILACLVANPLYGYTWSNRIVKVTAALAGAYAIHHLLQPASPLMEIANFNTVTFVPEQYVAPETVHKTIDIRSLCSRVQNKKFFDGINLKNTNCLAYKGLVSVPEAKTIVIICHGTGSQHCTNPSTFGLPLAYRYMRMGYIPTGALCIGYTNPNSCLKYLNFGQQNDQACLATVVTATVNANPQADIIILSCSNGAATTLNYLAMYKDHEQYKKHIKAVIVESPYINALRTAEHVGSTRLYWPLSKAPSLAVRYLPTSHVVGAPTILDRVMGIPQHIALLICALPHDHLTPYNDSKKIAQTIFKNGYKGLFCTFNDRDDDGNSSITHGHLARETDFLGLHHAFLASCGLEHTSSLAQEGAPIFEQAQVETASLIS